MCHEAAAVTPALDAALKALADGSACHIDKLVCLEDGLQIQLLAHFHALKQLWLLDLELHEVAQPGHARLLAVASLRLLQMFLSLCNLVADLRAKEAECLR